MKLLLIDVFGYKMRQKKIVFWGINGSTGFSGGRYHAWLMAEALAELGWDVTYITNNIPSFRNDFSSENGFPKTKSIKLVLDNITSDTFKSYDIECGVVVVVPHMNCHGYFTDNALRFAKLHRAKIMLLNFESANWYNLLSPVKRKDEVWRGWRELSLYASSILSSAEESSKYAKQYYGQAPDRCRFDSCWAPINTRIADMLPYVKKENRVVLFARFAGAEHKGNQYLDSLLSMDLGDTTIVLITNVSKEAKPLVQKYVDKARQNNVRLEVHSQLSEQEKWMELKKAMALLFFSFFEGFGLPPVEAQYAGAQCVAFHLPVLEEVSGDGIHFVPPGDIVGLEFQLRKILNGAVQPLISHDTMRRMSFEKYKVKIGSIVEAVYQSKCV